MRQRSTIRRRVAAAVGTIGCLAVLAGTAVADFPNDPPNDPSYDPAEEGGPETCTHESVNDEQHYFYSFMPQCTPQAQDPENASGMSVDSAWRDFTTGNGHTVIAYIEGGINWRQEPRELADQVFLNRGELPPPTTPTEDGQLNAADYHQLSGGQSTPDGNGNGYIDAEDVIVGFSDGVDDDHNGFTDDISGWDFYDHQNDPATVDSTYGHSDDQMRQTGAETNNGIHEAGLCPKCVIMPIKAGAEALDRSDDLAQAWIYAADMKVDVLESVTADLGYSSFMDQAVRYAWRHDVVMTESSNDFNSTDHQGGMFHPFVLPGNGMVTNSQGIPGPEANAATTTYRARSGLTSWGTHNMFTASTNGGSTSESTPTIGGVMALIRSYGDKAARQGLIDRPLSADETIQVVRATASDVDGNPNPPFGWEGKPGWDLQYGYGRPNVHAAMQAIHDGDVPPEAWINSPAWYHLYDPTKRSTVPVRGHVGAPRSNHYTYKIQFAPGAEPSSGDFMRAGQGSGAAPRNGVLGTLDLSRIAKSFWSKAYSVSQTKTLETSEQYTVTIRLRVTDAHGRVAEDRRTIAVTHDPTWAKGFPRSLGSGGESQPALADLQGRGRLAIVFGDSDGIVHAIDGKTGAELPGWPVHTKRTRVELPHPGIDPGHEPIVQDVAVGDLRGNGRLDVLATSTTGRVYAWNAKGHPLRGWPKTLDKGVHKPAIPRPDMPFTRLPQRGATAAPVLYDLNGDERLEIVQAAWDGYVHVWRPNGKPFPGWPVKGTMPSSDPPPPGYVRIQDHKLDAPPAIGDIDGDGKPEIVLRNQFTDTQGPDIQPDGYSHVLAYHANGTLADGFPIDAPALIVYYGSAQEFITEGVSIPVLADVNGDGDNEIAFAAGIFSPPILYDGDGSTLGTYGPVAGATLDLLQGNADQATLLGVLGGDLPDDSPVNFTGAGAFGEFGPGGQLTFAEPASGGASVAASLVLAGSGIGLNNYETAYNAQSQAALPGFPSKLQGLDFLGSPVIADVSGDGQPEILNGADTSAIQAFDQTGDEAARFPKWMTGWTLFAPAVGDLNSDGRSELVATTREGYLFVWKTRGTHEGNQEWWRAGHDEQNTDQYGVDTRPPGIARHVRVHPRKGTLTLRAPGDDWYAGQADHYHLILRSGGCGRRHHRERNANATVPAGHTESIELPPWARRVRVFAVDEAGNRGRMTHFAAGCAHG